MSSPHDDHPDLPPPWVTEVADGIFAYVQPDGSWWINNTGFIAGTARSSSIDTCSTERRTRAYLPPTRAVTGPPADAREHPPPRRPHQRQLSPARSHGHRSRAVPGGDHSVWDLRPTAVFEPIEWGDLTPAPPFVTFEHRLDIYVDDLKVELIHLTPRLTPPTTSSPGFPSSACSSAATWSSTAAPRSW